MDSDSNFFTVSRGSCDGELAKGVHGGESREIASFDNNENLDWEKVALKQILSLTNSLAGHR